MPTVRDLLEVLAAMANDQIAIAIVWHIALAAVLVALLRGWRPTRRIAGMFLAAPLATVSLVAFTYGVAFNGLVFALATVALLATAARMPDDPVPYAPPWAHALGSLLIALGWVYPHFLTEYPPAAYLFAAPFAVVPCPTLAVVIGFTLIAGGFRSRSWTATVTALALLYGLIGVLRLHVWLDVTLLAGGVGLVALAIRRGSPRVVAATSSSTLHLR